MRLIGTFAPSFHAPYRGPQEQGSVNIRTRDNQVHGTKSVAETVEMFRTYEREYTREV